MKCNQHCDSTPDTEIERTKMCMSSLRTMIITNETWMRVSPQMAI